MLNIFNVTTQFFLVYLKTTICQCHLLPYYRTLTINKNNNTKNLTVMAVLYLNDYDLTGCSYLEFQDDTFSTRFWDGRTLTLIVLHIFIILGKSQKGSTHFPIKTGQSSHYQKCCSSHFRLRNIFFCIKFTTRWNICINSLTYRLYLSILKSVTEGNQREYFSCLAIFFSFVKFLPWKESKTEVIWAWNFLNIDMCSDLTY